MSERPPVPPAYSLLMFDIGALELLVIAVILAALVVYLLRSRRGH